MRQVTETFTVYKFSDAPMMIILNQYMMNMNGC